MPNKHVKKEFNNLKQAYIRYVQSYKFYNKGSLEGVTTFNDFYIYQTYTSKYSDPRRLATQAGR